MATLYNLIVTSYSPPLTGEKNVENVIYMYMYDELCFIVSDKLVTFTTALRVLFTKSIGACRKLLTIYAGVCIAMFSVSSSHSCI